MHLLVVNASAIQMSPLALFVTRSYNINSGVSMCLLYRAM